MFKEDQYTEFKRLWKDEYLREISAFANNDGGTLYVGVDDDGTIVGVNDVSTLLENFPNKIKNNLHFIAAVDRKCDGERVCTYAVHGNTQQTGTSIFRNQRRTCTP